jgi:hypothetical protein
MAIAFAIAIDIAIAIVGITSECQFERSLLLLYRKMLMSYCRSCCFNFPFITTGRLL